MDARSVGAVGLVVGARVLPAPQMRLAGLWVPCGTLAETTRALAARSAEWPGRLWRATAMA